MDFPRRPRQSEAAVRHDDHLGGRDHAMHSLIDQIDANPLQQLRLWLQDAERQGLGEANAMTLATANGQGQVSARIVLCKDITANGLVFYTNYESHKARDLAENQHAACVFYWQPLARQVCIEGRVKKVSRQTSEDYFATRPRESQVGAWASRQSQPVASFAAFHDDVVRQAKAFEGRAVPCPPHWGGYELQPERCEFWVAAIGRLHDRLVYQRHEQGWQRQQLYP